VKNTIKIFLTVNNKYKTIRIRKKKILDPQIYTLTTKFKFDIITTIQKSPNIIKLTPKASTKNK